MNIAVILAAGAGTRFLTENQKFPKGFYEFCRNAVISTIVEKFENHPLIDQIIIVSNLEYVHKTEELVKKDGFKKVRAVIAGGVTRQSCSYQAIHYLSKEEYIGNANIIIHEADRTQISDSIITANIEALKDHHAVATCVTVRDNLVETKDNLVSSHVDGKALQVLLSPQSFQLDTLRSAHRFANTLGMLDAPDDASLMRLLNEEVFLVEGDSASMKKTTEQDLLLLQNLFNREKSLDENTAA